MKVTVTFNPVEYFSYSFDIEGADWLTIFEQLEPIAEAFDKAHEDHFGKRTFLDRLRGK